MKRILLLISMLLVMVVLATGCADGFDAAEDSIDATADAMGDSLDAEADAAEDELDAAEDELDAEADAAEDELDAEFDAKEDELEDEIGDALLGSADDSVDATADAMGDELDAEADAAEEKLEAELEATPVPRREPTDLCSALDNLELSLDVLGDMDPDEHSVQEYQEQFEIVHEDFEFAREFDTEEMYTDELDRFEVALDEFEDSLTSLLAGEGGLFGGLFKLISGTASLAAAGEILDEAIDCPGDVIKGSAASAGPAPADLCTALDVLEVSLDELGDMDPGEHSVQEYQAQFEIVREDFEDVRAADSDDQYTAEFDRFELAMADFEESLTSLLSGRGGLFSGIFKLASGAAKLAAAGEILDEAIDCPGSDRDGTSGTGAATDGDAGQATGGPAPTDLCSALDVLEVSLDVLGDMDPDENSVEEYQEQFEVVRQDFENVQSFDTNDMYSNEFDQFELALAEFEEVLTSLLSGRAGLISGFFKLASGAADLALAGEILDEAIDCPSDALKGSASTDAPPQLCSAISVLDDRTEVLDEMDPDAELYLVQYALVLASWQEVLELGGDSYPEEFAAFQNAASRYEEKLEAFRDDNSVYALWNLAFATAEFILAEERLGFAVDCPDL